MDEERKQKNKLWSMFAKLLMNLKFSYYWCNYFHVFNQRNIEYLLILITAFGA